MGMYCYIEGAEIKFSGLIATVCSELGLGEYEPGFVHLSRREVMYLTSVMVRRLEQGRPLVQTNGMVHVQDLLRLSSDAEKTWRLLEWVNYHTSESKLTFC